jgi:TPR repeat protein
MSQNTRAQYNLGNEYSIGGVVQKDDVAAVNWYRKAAEQGYAPAQDSLGMHYDGGWGVPQDHALAHMWFNLAAASGYREAAQKRDLIASYMTRSQVAEAQKLAREWIARHPTPAQTATDWVTLRVKPTP